jgi:hypothetical protein
MRRVSLAVFAVVLPVAASTAALSFAGTAGAGVPPTPLVGTFELTPGSYASGLASGSYFRMLDPGAANNTSDSSYVTNGNSTSSDQTYTLLTPGTEGGLVTGAYEPEPSPAFDSNGNSLASEIIEPTEFFNVFFGLDTNATDPQTGDSVPAPSISADASGNLTGNLEAFAASWNNQEFNQGSPKPGGTFPGSGINATEPVSGTYNSSTGAYVLNWQSIIVGGPFNNFTGVWHLAGTFVPAAVTVTSVSPATGTTAGGTSVTITGTDLGAATAVNFGSVAATSVDVTSGTTVVATAPAASPGTVDITVVTPFGTTPTSAADQFTYRYPTTLVAKPAVLSLSPLAAPLFTLSATLTESGTGAPILGQAITFTAGGTTLGVADANSSGVASLSIVSNSSAVLSTLESDGYTAEFAQTATYLPSADTAPLIGL